MWKKKYLKKAIFIVLVLVVFLITRQFTFKNLNVSLEIEVKGQEVVQLFYDNQSKGYPFDEQHSEKKVIEQQFIEFEIPIEGSQKLRIDFDGMNEKIELKNIKLRLFGKTVRSLQAQSIVEQFGEKHDVALAIEGDRLILTKVGEDVFIASQGTLIGGYKILVITLQIVCSLLGAIALYFIALHTIDSKYVVAMWTYKKELTLIGVFISFLYLPNILGSLGGSEVSNENRQLKQKPNLSWESIARYPSEYEAYYTDHLPFKNKLSKFNSFIKYELLNMSSGQYVIKGTDGWLFYNSKAKNDADTLGDYMGSNHYTLEQLEQIKECVISKQSELEKLGIEFYVFIAPNKSNVYSMYMPEYYKRINQETKTDRLVAYLREHTTVPIIYPKEELIKASKEKETYYKLDTHWNALGGYIGFDELMQLIDPNYISVPLEQLNVESQAIDAGDLAGMINMNGLLADTLYTITDYRAEIVPELIEENGSTFYRYKSNSPRDQKLLMFRDSFSSAWIPYMNKEFEESIFVWSHVLDQELIEREAPDIVILEMVERYVDALGN